LDHTQQLLTCLRAEAPGAAAQAAAIGAPLYYGLTARWFSDPSACFDAVLADLRSAEKSIWLSVPTIVPGVMWETVLSVLRRKAACGLDVRLVYDGFRSRLPLHYVNRLSPMHIHCRPQYRGSPLRALIVDDDLCYTGDLTVRDSRIGLRSRRGAYRTAVLRMQGGAAAPLCARFLSYFPDAPAESPPQEAGEYGYLSFFQNAPAVLSCLIRRAERSVCLMAPGLSPRTADALYLAAASGVEVRTLLNHSPLRTLPGVQIVEDGRRITACACVADGQTAAIIAGREGLWLHSRAVCAGIEADLRAMFDSPHPRLYSGWKGRLYTWSRAFPGR
jgi:phosphatidylserine/phosphatidylglycerophosphate/cardiolipin synthase-like enzyme